MANTVMEEEQTARRKRVDRLKKLIVWGIGIAILIPTILCIILFVCVSRLSKDVQELTDLIAARAENDLEVTEQTSGFIMEPEELLSTKNEAVLQETGQDKKIRRVYLTFDDGPSIYTDEILDILKEYDVKATFFVVGKDDEESVARYQRIVEEGHTLGMHSYSHKYNEIYESLDAYAADFSKLQEFLYETTGVWSRICRFPGGSSNQVSKVPMEELITYLDEQDITYYDWNISAGDASNRYISTEAIVENCLGNIESYNTAAILLHDASNKKTTVEALPIILEQLIQMEDTEVLPITDDTIPIQHIVNTTHK